MPQSDLIVRVGANLTDFDRGMAQVSSTLSKIENTAERMTIGFRKLGDHLQSIGTALTVSVTAPLTAFGAVAVRSAADLDALKRGLVAVAGSASEAERQLKRLEETAKLPGLGFREAVQAAIALQAVGFEFERAVRIIEAVGNALAMVGRGREDLQEVIRQLGQLESRGKVTADNLKPLIERIPQLATIMKEAFGTVDTEVLQKMGVTSRQFIDTMLEGLERLPRVTGGFKNELENLRDAMERSLARAGEAIMPLAEVLVRFAEQAARQIKIVADAFLALPQPVQQTVLALAALSAAAGPVVFGMGQMVSAVGMIGRAVIALPAAFSTAVGAVQSFGTALGHVQTAIATGVTTGLTALELKLLALQKAALLASAAFLGWQLGKWLDENVISKVPALDRFFDLLAAAPAALYERLSGATGAVKRANDDLAASVELLEAKLRAKGITIERGNLTLEQYAAKLREAAKQAAGTADGVERVRDRAEASFQAKLRAAEAARAMREAHAQAEREARALAEALELLGLRTREQVEVERLHAAWNTIAQAYERGKVSAEELARAHEALQQKLDAIRQADVQRTFDAITVGAARSALEVAKVYEAADKVVRSLSSEQAMTVPTWWDNLNRVQNETAQSARIISELYTQALPEGLWKTTEVTEQAAKKQSEAFQTLQRQVSTIITDLSRGLTDLIWKGGSLRDIMIGAFEQIGKALTRFVIEDLTGKLIKALRGLLDGELPSLGSALKSLWSQLEAVGDAFTKAFGGGSTAGAGGTPRPGGATSGTGPTGGAGGVAGWVSAITEVVSSILGYFQGRRIEQDVGRIEVTTRGILSQLQALQDAANQWWPWIRNLADPMWSAVDLLAGIHAGIYELLHSTREALERAMYAGAQAVNNAMRQPASVTIPVSVQVTGRNPSTSYIAEDVTDRIVRTLKAAGYQLY